MPAEEASSTRSEGTRVAVYVDGFNLFYGLRAKCGKRVVVAFPPERRSNALRSAATGTLAIGRDAFRDSQLPDVVVGKEGHELRRPPSWS
jgi:hypothetical protein